MSLLKKIIRKLATRMRRLQRDIAFRMGLYHSFFKNARGNRILIYHGICEKEPHKFNSLFVTRKRFERHLRFYKKYFNVLSLDDFCAGKADPSRFNLCISFDDGFANNFHHALPLLEKYQLPATFFVTAIRKEGYNILWNDFLSIASVYGPPRLEIGGEIFYKGKHQTYFSTTDNRTLSNTLRDCSFARKNEMMRALEPYVSAGTMQLVSGYWLQMTTDQLRQCAASRYITIGSHGYYHNDLGRIDSDSVLHELRQSKSFLENVTGKAVTQVAYPYGSHNSQTLKASADAGYSHFFITETVDASSKTNNSVYERMGINPYISTRNQLYAIVSGSYA